MIAKRIYRVRGMDCAEEVEALKATVGRLHGVTQLDFNLLNAAMSVTLDDSLADDAQVLEGVRRAGLSAVRLDEAAHESGVPVTEDSFWERRGRLLACLGSFVFLGAGVLSHAIAHRSLWDALVAETTATHTVPAASLLCYLAAAVLGGWHVAPKAAAAASGLRPDMNLLMTIAVLGAAAIGQWFEAATVSFLFALALLLESWSVSRARHAITALTKLTPPKARIARPQDGGIVEKPLSDVAVDETALVRPGERIPLDGIVIEGATTVNEAPITGESRPVDKAVGAEVLAGTINNVGAFSMRVTRGARDTLLARIIRMVEEAENRRAPVEQWVDRFAHRYTPVMLAVALLVALLPPLLAGDWGRWFYQALVMLVIACPCALVISTPIGIVAGLTAAARHGVLIKGGVFLEQAARIRVVALDKTGTLTRGRPEVQTVLAFSGHTPDEVLERAAAIEASSEHPLARAVRRKAAAEGLAPRPADGVRAFPGKGAEGRIGGRLFWIGSHRLMHERGEETPEIHDQAERMEDAGHSVVAVGNDEHVCGLLSIADAPRPAAAQVVRELKRLGVRRVVMLTGDNEGTADAIARQVGVDQFRAELLPGDKMAIVHALGQEEGPVAMVGDGVNDAPAMAAASLGIAMGTAGSDAAIETADIALMADDLTRLPWLIRHSRRVMSTLRTNMFFALGLKAAIMILALAGLATLWMAIAADMGASLVVVFWSLRLLKG